MKTLIRLTVSLVVLAATSAFATVRYVDANSASPTLPYTNWATAATTIQDAVDAAEPGDEIEVTNGTYATGGRAMGTNMLVNRVAVDKPIALRSVNGPQFTIIKGYQVPGTTNGDGDPVRLSDRRRQPVRLHLDPRGHTVRRGLVRRGKGRRAVL
ncbi:MAG: hypothetical protein AB9869_12490 [Verrucomicrobiia bacterium]